MKAIRFANRAVSHQPSAFAFADRFMEREVSHVRCFDRNRGESGASPSRRRYRVAHNCPARRYAAKPVPVWFLWDGEAFLAYSQPGAQKLKNIRKNPRVAINLNSGAGGNDVVRAEGSAEIDEYAPPATEVSEYIEKYRSNIPEIGMSEEGFAETYRTAVRVRPERWQVW